ncbi:MAG: ATP-binding protein [Brevinematia bacterium]
MVRKEFTLIEKLEELLNIFSFIECFSELAIVDQDEKIILLKSEGILSKQDLVNIFNVTKENYTEFKIPFTFGDYGGYNLISFYFRSKESELVLVGLSNYQELGIREISVFKLIALSVKDVIDMVELTANIIDRIGELEALLSFYKSITTPLDRELFLAYILDNIMAETSVEVGSIMIVGNDLTPISSFHLGLSEEVTRDILSALKQANRSDEISVLEVNEIEKILHINTKGLKNVIFFPIKFENEIVGIVLLANKRIGINYVEFSKTDIEKLRVLLNPVGIIIKNYIMFRDLFFLNQLNQKILSNIGSIIVMTDSKYNVKYTNKEEFRELVQKLIESSKDNEGKFDKGVELQVDGRFYEVKAQPILDEQGKVTEIVWTVEDVTYRKELINRYILSEKMNMMSEVVSGIAHEIRNPVTSISGFIELLKVKGDDPKFIEKFIEVTSRDVERIINLLNSFIRFAKPVGYEISDVSLSSVIYEALDVLMYQINQKSIKVENTVSEEIVIKGNYNLLLQVFTNIILNSIQAISGVNGRIKIGSVDCSSDGCVMVFVEDNGVGIPKDIQEKIFDPFFTTKPNGTGLGLSISQKIVMEHGGVVKVKSEEGKGTKVMIFLPYDAKQKIS